MKDKKFLGRVGKEYIEIGLAIKPVIPYISIYDSEMPIHFSWETWFKIIKHMIEISEIKFLNPLLSDKEERLMC